MGLEVRNTTTGARGSGISGAGVELRQSQPILVVVAGEIPVLDGGTSDNFLVR
jgi:hypothetical protein